MSDTDRDVKLNPGTGGAQIATEFTQLGGITAHFQLIKPVHGASGTINFVGDDAPWPSILRGGASNNKLTTTLLSGSNDTLDVNLRGNSGANFLTVDIRKFAGISLGLQHGLPIANVGRTGGIFLAVAGDEAGAPITVTGGTGGFYIRNLDGGTAGFTYDNTANLDFVLVQGVTGAFPVGITAGTPLLVKFPSGEGLSAGAPGAVQGAPHSVAVQGMSGAFAVGVTAGSTVTGGLMIRGLTSSYDSITVHGYDGAVPVGVTAGAGGFNIRGLTTGGDNGVLGDHVIVHSLMADGSTGNTLDTRRLLSTTDTVGVTGMGKYGSINTQLTGSGGNMVGVSGDALKVSVIDATIAATVNVGTEIEVSNDAGNGLYVQGTTTGNPLTITAASGATFTCIATNFDIRNLEPALDAVRIVGTTGSYNVGVTAGAPGPYNGLNIRRLDGGTAGFTGSLNDGNPDTGYVNIDTVAIQGMCGGYHVTVGATAGGFGIRTITSATDSIRVVGNTGSYDIGITAGSQISGNPGLNVRRLYGGTAGFTGSLNDGTPDTGYINIDTVAIQGICGAYPIGVTTGSNPLMVTSSITDPIAVTGAGNDGRLGVNIFGSTGGIVGVSGDALRVSVSDAIINATVSVATDVEINNDGGNPIPIAGGNTAAVRIEGSSADGVYSNVFPVMIAGSTGYDSIPVRVAGVTGGTPLRIATDSENPVNITNISGTVSLPTGAATDATLSAYFADLGNTLGLLGATLDMLINKFPGGVDNVDNTDSNYIVPSFSQMSGVANDINSSKSNLDSIKNSSTSLASAVSDNTLKVTIDAGSAKNPSSFTTGQVSVDASSTVIASSTPLLSGVNIKGHPRNEDHIFIENNTDADGGYPLGAGEEVFVDVDNLNLIYAYADQSGLTLCYFAR